MTRLRYKYVFFVCLLICVKGFAQQDQAHTYASRLWYKKPAINFNEALPIGNGRMGVMVFGGIKTDTLVLNEATLWSGAPRDWNNPQAKNYLPLVREAALAGKYKKADSLARFMQGPYTESYMPLADLIIHYTLSGNADFYTRSLNLDSAITTTKFRIEHTISRTAFVSFPDKAVVYHCTSAKKADITFAVELKSKLHYSIQIISPNHIVLKGKAPKHVEPQYLWRIPDSVAVQFATDSNGEGMNFEVHLLVKNKSGTIRIESNRIIVEKADDATLLITSATSFNGFNKSPGLQGKDPAVNAKKDLQAVVQRSYVQLLQRHVQDYQPIYRRVSLNLGKNNHPDWATDKSLMNMDSVFDPELLATIFQYGRYLLISSSRPGGQPANLKGIWNDKLRPEYSSNWSIDHDAQMFYYPVETGNLSEMHEPFLQLITELSENGKKTAAVNYGMHGWVSHHNTDIWRQSAPVGNWGQGNPPWANFNMSAAWLCAHFYDHYLFTGDRKFLLKNAWPVMREAAVFCLEWLIYDKNGMALSVPSVSPENSFVTPNGDTCDISVNTTVNIALLKELFKNCIQTASTLRVDSAFVLRLKTALSKLPAYPIGSRGQLLEWNTEWESFDPTHRHLSHLYPVFPGNEINPYDEPALTRAAKKALTDRKKTNSSWGFAWKAACWARLGEGDSAWATLKNQLQYADPLNKNKKYNIGLYPNLFNSEVPSIIMNGNACTTAVITEMIMQSTASEIILLPALPGNLASGSVSGLKARGGFEVQCEWKNEALSNATIISKLGNDCRIRSRWPVRVFSKGKQLKVMQSTTQQYSFKTEIGKVYQVVPAK